MRKLLFIYIITGILILTGFLLYIVMLKAPARLEANNTAINEITKQAALCWENPDHLDKMDFAYRFLVIDHEGSVHYASDENLPSSLQSAIRHGFLPMDITANSSIVGKALIETFPDEHINESLKNLSTAAYIAFALLCLLMIATFAVLYVIVIRPFRRLEMFAHKISTGKFDEPLPMDKNNLFGLFTQSFDVMRASLLEARQKQLMAEHSQKELIASLNHDIKTPVTSIKLISELLQASGVDLAVEEKLKTIDAKADQIDRLINDMLFSALEELGELKVNLTSENSGVLLTLFESADHLSKARLGDIPSCLVELDSTRMAQVIDNILTNSYKYAETDIDVAFKIFEGFLQVDVNDFGNGVKPDELELICTKFYRGENAKASQKEGEGLGLYIAKQLLEKMGGGLEAFNREDGFGIRLWIQLSK